MRNLRPSSFGWRPLACALLVGTAGPDAVAGEEPHATAVAPTEAPEVDPFLRRPVPGGDGRAPVGAGHAYFEVEVRHLVFAADVAARWFGSAEAVTAVPASEAEVSQILAGIARGPGPLQTGASTVLVDEGRPVWSRVLVETDPSVPCTEGVDVDCEPVGVHVGVLPAAADAGRLRLDLDVRCAWIVAAGPTPNACAPTMGGPTYAARAARLVAAVADGGAVLVGPLGRTAKGGVRAALVQGRRASPPQAETPRASPPPAAAGSAATAPDSPAPAPTPAAPR